MGYDEELKRIKSLQNELETELQNLCFDLDSTVKIISTLKEVDFHAIGAIISNGYNKLTPFYKEKADKILEQLSQMQKELNRK